MSETTLIRHLLAIPGKGGSQTLVLLLALTAAGLALLLGRDFFNVGTMQSMASQVPELGLLALAMSLSLLSGGINLSIVATANFSAIVTSFLVLRLTPAGTTAPGGLGIAAAIAGGLVAAMGVGLLNGVLIARLRVSPILATLGTMTLFKGLSVGLTKGGVMSGFPPELTWFGSGYLIGIPVAALVFAICALWVGVMLTRTPFGISIYMIGSNERATRYSGVRTDRVLIRMYVLSGLLSGIAAIVMMGRFNSANASYAESYLLVTILAAVLGGISPSGGFGRVGGLVLSLLILQFIASGLNALGLSSYLTLAIWGLILVVAAGVKARFGPSSGRS